MHSQNSSTDRTAIAPQLKPKSRHNFTSTGTAIAETGITRIRYTIAVGCRFAFRFCVLFNGTMRRRYSNAFQVSKCSSFTSSTFGTSPKESPLGIPSAADRLAPYRPRNHARCPGVVAVTSPRHAGRAKPDTAPRADHAAGLLLAVVCTGVPRPALTAR